MTKTTLKTKKYILAIISIISFSLVTIAQNFQWAKRIGGIGEESCYTDIDDAGNTYIAGIFTGSVDFDPGVGTYNLTSAGERDIFISKLDSSGNFVWAKLIGGINNDFVGSISVDALGNIYTIGKFKGTVDFNPGVGTYNLTTNGSDDFFILKLDVSGNFVWAKKIYGNNNIAGYALAIDALGNSYTVGYFKGLVDFDSGSAIYNLTSAGNEDVFILKLDASGNFVWAKSIGGAGQDFGNSIAVDVSGNVYTTGLFTGTADFNPGAGVFNMSVSLVASNMFILKLDTFGDFVWAKRIGGNYDCSGDAITVDAIGSIYTTGYFAGLTDFDPNAGTYNLTPAIGIGGYDVFILKLDSSGNFVWAKCMGGTNTDSGRSIVIDGSQNVYCTGIFMDVADFDGGVGIYNLTSAGNRDVFISKLDSSGNFIWAKQIGGTSYDDVTSIAVDISSHVYVAGTFEGTSDFDPNAPTYNMSAVGSTDIFVSKLCTPPAPIGIISGPSTICEGASATYAINPVSGASGYSWNVPSGAIINSGQNTTSINVTFGSIAGNIEVSLSNCCACAPPNPLSVVIAPKPVIGVIASPSLTICMGSTINLNGTGAYSYTWNNGVVDGQSFIPLYPLNYYTVTGTDTNGCINSYNVTVTTNPLPIVSTVASPSSTICAGTSVSLSGAGAATYIWSNGIINGMSFSPDTTSTYTVSGIAGNGCINTDTVSIVVNPLPTVGAIASPQAVCLGSGLSLNGTGASAYTWSDDITDGVYFEPSSTKTYEVIGVDSNGCVGSPISITVLVYPLPIITSDISDANYGNNGIINISITNGLPPYSYDWSIDGTGDWNDSANQAGLSEGEYTLIVSDQNGCRDTMDATITNGGELLIPTGISPNADGFNDKWVILGIEQLKDVQVSIFNLQGQCIYNQQKQYIPWDGLYNGMLVPVSDYYYVIESVIKKKKLTGTITVKY